MARILSLSALLFSSLFVSADYSLIKFDELEAVPKCGSGYSAKVNISYSLYLNTTDKKYYLEITGASSSQEKFSDLRSGKTYTLSDIGTTNILNSSEKAVYKLRFALDQWKGEEISLRLHEKKAISLQLDWATLTNEERIEKAKAMVIELTTVNIHSTTVAEIQANIDKKNGVKTMAPGPTSPIEKKD